MDYKTTMNNFVLIKLDPENQSIRLKNGFELYVDISYDPEKHSTVTGIVWGLPSKLKYSGQPNLDMPWKTPMELKLGDHVICYYLSIVNALKSDTKRYILEGNDRYVMVPYQFLYCKYGDGFIQPINGYNLIEPMEPPEIEVEKAKMKAMGMERVVFSTESKTRVSYGRVKYVSTPIEEYVDENYTDKGVDIAPGDVVVLKKINDIPLQYELHSKIEGGKKLWRVQRRNILARL